MPADDRRTRRDRARERLEARRRRQAAATWDLIEKGLDGLDRARREATAPRRRALDS